MPAQTAYKSEYKMSLVMGPAFAWGKGDQTREFSAIRQGVIDLAVGSTINRSPQVKELNIFSRPFLMPDYAAANALTQGEVGKEIFRIVEKAGVVPLAGRENGHREFSNSKLAIKKPEDLKGLKIRVVGSPLFLDTFTALGTNPTKMSFADARPALVTGAVDGQENPLSIHTAAELHNSAKKHITMWGYVNDPLIFVVNKDVWASWTRGRPRHRQAGRAWHDRHTAQPGRTRRLRQSHPAGV